jgi:hypothetical protein
MVAGRGRVDRNLRVALTRDRSFFERLLSTYVRLGSAVGAAQTSQHPLARRCGSLPAARVPESAQKGDDQEYDEKNPKPTHFLFHLLRDRADATGK